MGNEEKLFSSSVYYMAAILIKKTLKK